MSCSGASREGFMPEWHYPESSFGTPSRATHLGGGDMEILLGCQACRVLWHNQVGANSSKPFCRIGTINLLVDRYRAKCILMQQTPALLDYMSYVVNDMNNHLVPKTMSKLQFRKRAVHMFFGQKGCTLCSYWNSTIWTANTFLCNQQSNLVRHTCVYVASHCLTAILQYNVFIMCPVNSMIFFIKFKHSVKQVGEWGISFKCAWADM